MPLTLMGNISASYKEWIRTYEIYAIASGVAEKTEKIQCNVFLHVAGPEAQKIHSTMTFTEDEADKIVPLKLKFKEFCAGKKNITVVRYKFNKTYQKVGETFDSFVTGLREQLVDCEYGTLENSLLKDKIVCGIHDDSLREKLLQSEDLDLDRCCKLCRLSEITSKDLAQNTSSVDYIRSQKRPTNPHYSQNRQPQQKGADGYRSRTPGAQSERGPKKCSKCGGESHKSRADCPAQGKICYVCKKKNHFGSVCRSGKGRTSTVYDIEADGEFHNEMYEDELFIGVLKTNSNKRAWIQDIKIQNAIISFKLDSGSEADILPAQEFDRLKGIPISPSSTKLVSYTGHKMIPLGVVHITVNGCELEFQVVEGGDAILGRESCEKLGYVRRIHAITETDQKTKALVDGYKDVFSGLGVILSQYHIEVDPNIQPCIDPPRRVAHALTSQVKSELSRMEEMGVIKRQYEPTPWVNSMTIVRKPGKIRICIDPTKLNKAIKRAHHPTKTIEQIAATMPNATIFTKLDANAGYWQVKLDDSSSKLCTFNTPWGRYRFTRLPFGITTSGDVFNQMMENIFGDLDGVETVVDDILVHGTNPEEHYERLRKVLALSREVGRLKLNQKKILGWTQLCRICRTYHQ